MRCCRYVPSFLLCNWLARADGFPSIRKAFQRDELTQRARDAGVAPERISIRWVWPFRWQMVLSAPAATHRAKTE